MERTLEDELELVSSSSDDLSVQRPVSPVSPVLLDSEKHTSTIDDNDTSYYTPVAYDVSDHLRPRLLSFWSSAFESLLTQGRTRACAPRDAGAAYESSDALSNSISKSDEQGDGRGHRW